jgi:hypothetical protein
MHTPVRCTVQPAGVPLLVPDDRKERNEVLSLVGER